MKLRFTTGTIAGFSARHPWWVIGVWVLFIILAAVATPHLGAALSGEEMKVTSGLDSVKGQTVIDGKINASNASSTQTETIVIHSDKLTVDDPAFQQVVEKTKAAVTGAAKTSTQVYDYYLVKGLAADQAGQLVSADRHTTLVAVMMTGSSQQIDAGMSSYIATVDAQSAPGFSIGTVGGASMGHVFSSTAESDLSKAETIGLPITLGVLVLVFGALVAAGISLLLALVSIFASVGLIVVVGHFVPQSFFIVNVVMMIGLAVGIDYALFIIERYREERRQGLDRHEAIVATGNTANRAVLFSGGTVMLALLGLFLVPITTFRSLGTGALLVVGVAVLAMLTLVPALLSLVGDRVNWPLVRWHRRRDTGQRVHGAHTMYKGFWGRLTRGIMARPLVGVILTVVVLVAISSPAIMLKTSSPGQPSSLPPGKERTAYELLVKNFPAGMLSPLEVVVDAPRTAAVDAAITRLESAMAASGDFSGQATVSWNAAGTAALISAPLKAESDSDAAYQVVLGLRSDVIPAAFAHLDVPVHVTGDAALNGDSLHMVNTLTPAVLAFVLGLTFILLLLVFRSLIVPITAMIMNLLSVGAAYGMLVLFFQMGLGHRLFGFQQSTIESYVPIFLFCILFGLSMDYHVFLLSRIQEHFHRTDKSREAVAVGLKATSRIITGAAMIMVVVFATFASGNLVMLQQVGFGLAVAVLIDATLIRSVLVPATMALLGRISWYLPRALHRVLPRIRLEGGPASPVRPPA